MQIKHTQVKVRDLVKQYTDDTEGNKYHILLEDLPKEYSRLSFLINLNEVHLQKQFDLSVEAGNLVGRLYDTLLSKFAPTDDEEQIKRNLHSLNVLCVRLVFCLYAEDAELFNKDSFAEYLKSFRPENARQALIDFFKWIDTKDEDRDPYADDKLKAFPYVNGGLFHDNEGEKIIIPPFDEEVISLIVNDLSLNFNWSAISPTIFGAVFESTLNPETRRSGGMHYTSIQNIHKVIDPLFLDELKAEFEQIKQYKTDKKISQECDAFQNKLATLKFLDPACGSGNFLTETYICLRKLENEVILFRSKGMSSLSLEELNPVKVSIHQFYGIEINDFACAVATTALWIAESQMLHETEEIIHRDIDFLPLKSNSNIVEGNALRMDWNDVIQPSELNYIMGNPPFVGYSNQTKEQKEDILSVYIDEKGKTYKTAGKIDYVAAWYMKAATYIKGSYIRVAFVSTNSITQGEQVTSVWKPLIERFSLKIIFAWRTFVWNNEAKDQAKVHCVIIGFDCTSENNHKFIFDEKQRVNSVDGNISPYLIKGQNIFIKSRNKPICNVPEMITGNRAADGGALFIEKEDYEYFINKEPNAKKYIKKAVGANEFINNKTRYCLWLVGVSPKELNSMPLVLERVQRCKEDRLKGAPDRQKLADTPALFRETNNPEHCIIVPKTSSSARNYIPLGFGNKEIICTDSIGYIPNGDLYVFGVLTSIVHMAWTRVVCGRMKSDYSYSNTVVYNNFIWADATDEQKEKISKTAQAILDARALYPDCSLSDLYDPLTMPPELLKAHKANDKAVLALYGFKSDATEEEIVAKLMQMYAEKTKEEA